ncbi:MAG: DHH family phosphoesterase [Clostridia bacterium]|nr:DHH family phosphoesterase [Clostridia bacterium]
MRNLTFKAACRNLYELSRRGKLALLVHARPDGDCIGSAYATAVLLEAVGCRAHVVCADPLPARLRFIAETAKQDGSITLDTIPADFLPGNVTAVALDIAASTQLGCLEGKYDIALSFDHHARSTAFCDRYLSADASATGEIVWRIAREWLRMGYLDAIPEGVAPAIYAAISSDTGCFRYSNVTPATHRTAAQLIALIPSHSDIDRLLFETKTPGRLAAEKAALDLLTFAGGGKIAVCSISLEQISAHNLASEDLDALIDIARSVAGVEIAFSIREEARDLFRISARSNSTADVSALCAYFGGGGHVKAAGCTVSANSLEHAREIIIERAEKLIS